MFAPASDRYVREELLTGCVFFGRVELGRYEPTVRPDRADRLPRDHCDSCGGDDFVRDARSYRVLVSTAGEPGLFQSMVPCLLYAMCPLRPTAIATPGARFLECRLHELVQRRDERCVEPELLSPIWGGTTGSESGRPRLVRRRRRRARRNRYERKKERSKCGLKLHLLAIPVCAR